CSRFPELVTHFADKAAERLGREPVQFSDGAINLLCDYRWPGNVRQLENVITRTTIFADADTVDADEIRGWLFEHSGMTGGLQASDLRIQDSGKSHEAASEVRSPKSEAHRSLVSARFSPGNGIVRWEEERGELLPNTSRESDFGGHGVTALPPNHDEDALPFVGMTLHEMEEQLIRLTLERFNGHRAKTAAALGIGLRTLTSRLQTSGFRLQKKSSGLDKNLKSEVRCPKPEAVTE
ncbi:MAG: hypothetical protein FWH27_06730, partial [Planctomycetaceae bacterium]|nr:hypothetical protein [Planctomycetaceae bacterium]